MFDFCSFFYAFEWEYLCKNDRTVQGLVFGPGVLLRQSMALKKKEIFQKKMKEKREKRVWRHECLLDGNMDVLESFFYSLVASLYDMLFISALFHVQSTALKVCSHKPQ